MLELSIVGFVVPILRERGPRVQNRDRTEVFRNCENRGQTEVFRNCGATPFILYRRSPAFRVGR